ncbi:hypothetical protein EUGRSUZ_K02527 [Eucalyptus grandis]|uniref:Uncharacterized protein n=2 Tax=Eucalyptus grandis TaxID=71139 RepID=A0ACC3IWQ2_EUCGR|nr:hypothetical protein EUGRSUZ_K02527 [Eucalyptus grandis]
MTNYKKEKQRINEIERLRQKREELLFELQEAEIRYELARDAELRYSAIEDDMEEGPGNSSKVVRFWDGEYEAITAGSVGVSQRLMNQVKELNDLRDKLQPRIMMFWKKKARINQIRQFKQKVGEFLSLQKGVKLDELIRAKNLQYHAIKKVEAAITHLEGNTEENSMNSWTSIPVLRLGPNEKERSAGLAERLHQKVVGQDQAVGAVAEAVLRSRAWLGGPQGPTNSFLFLGPTGVGKTELAKALTEQLFGDENLLIRINMSEYAEQHSVSRLIGSPPGYDGHEVVGQLTEAVRGRPYSVVVLEWVEKAHIAVMNVLLKVLDEGRLTDGQGRTVL